MDIKDVSTVSPALARYAEESLFGRAWQRPTLSQRDRSIITLAAVITRGQTDALAFQTGYALEQEVTPREISEIVTHLAFYAGWYNGTAAAIAVGNFFPGAVSALINFRPHRPICCHLIGQQKTIVRAQSNRWPDPSRPASWKILAQCCSTIFGSVPTLLRVIAVW